MVSRKSPQRAITMHDVARLAGVSQSTVSRILSASSSPSPIPISQDTVQRVQDAIKQLGYYPNQTARSLRTQRTHLIAVMIADITNAFYHAIARTVQDIAAQHNYDVIIANTDHIYDYEKRFCETIMRRPVDGIIMIPYHLTIDELDTLITRTDTNIVTLTRHIDHPLIDTVSADDGKATYETIQWLINHKGHTRIGFIGVPEVFPPGARRLHGYQQALNEAGIVFNPDWVQLGDFTHESGQSAMQTLLSQASLPTAVFACNDLMAIGALNTALDMGFRVPEDVAIVGFDNIPTATLVRPRLTTIAQYPVEMATLMVKSLLERIEGGYEGPARRYETPLHLFEREST